MLDGAGEDVGDGLDAAVGVPREAGDTVPPYTALLRTVEGQEVWRGEAADRPTFRIPATALVEGDYVAELSSGSDPGPRRYYVRFLR